jgi:acyl carrier protein
VRTQDENERRPLEGQALMSSQSNPTDVIRSFVVQQFPAARKRVIDEKVRLLESGIVDSLGMLDLVSFLEKSFSIQIADEELTPENFATIASLTDFVKRKNSQFEAAAR